MLQDEFEMENQGYEEETVTRLFNRQYSMQSSPTIIENSRSSSTAQGIHAIGIRPLRAEPEAHVYEDIAAVPSLEDSISTDRSFGLPTNSANDFSNELESLHCIAQRNNNNVQKCPRTNGTVSLSSDEHESSNNFHRNLTLPLSCSVRALDAAKNASRFSVRVTNRERTGCLPSDNPSSLYESSIGSSRISDEMTMVTSHVVDKPSGRRRRKKDCKHCKSKTNGEGIRELLSIDSIGDSTIHKNSTIFPIDVSSGRVQASENNEFIGLEEKIRLGLEPIFTLPDGKLPSFNSQRSSQGTPLSDGRGNSIFSISNNINVSGLANGPKPLNYDKNDTDLRLVPVELSDDRALITPQKNRCNGMKVNSIYSQDHWHYKEMPIFVTDVKEQSPFQNLTQGESTS